MRCPFCGYDNTEGSKFCSGCGRDLRQQEQQRSVQDSGFPERPPERRETVRGEEEYRRRQPPRKPERSSEEKKIIRIGIILACVVVAAGIGAYFGITYFLDSRPGNSGGQSSAAIEEREEEASGSTPTPTPSETVTETPTPTPTPTDTPEPTPETVTVSLVDVNRTALASYTKASVVSGTASSTVIQEGYDNSVNMLFDGDLVTSWQEGADGDGINEFVNLRLDREYQVKYITLNLGNWRDQQRYDENNVPKSLTVWLDEKSFKVEFPHERTQFCLEFSQACAASEIYIRIDEVYEGNLWDDTCISEVGIYGE